MTKREFTKQLRVGLFADRGVDLKAAMEYAYSIAQASENPAAVTTALHVVLNTVANVLEREVDVELA
jgi:hypothetical protein